MALWEGYLKTIYLNHKHPGGFAGPQNLYKVIKNEGKSNIALHRMQRCLDNQESLCLLKPVKRCFQRNQVISAGKVDLWTADLIDMVMFADRNPGFKYIRFGD